jgi:prephenate dehydrogenase
MTIQITILGLGQIGASIGMALKENKVTARRVGFDRDRAVASASQTLNVVDEIKGLPDAVRTADVILLCLPLAEMRETLKGIAPHLKENAVVMDTAPVKNQMIQWAKEFIPEGRFYLGLIPALTVEALSAPETGLHAARPDLFQRTVMVVDAPPGTPEEVEQLAFSLAGALGAKPMHADAAESDGLMATTHLLPQLTSAALLNATVDEPGWSEARKLAGQAYVAVTSGVVHDGPASQKAAALSNREAVLRSVDALIASLASLRDDISKGNEQGLTEQLEQAFEARKRWLDERASAAWLKEGGDADETPDFGGQMLRFLFGSSVLDRMKKKK